MRKEESFDENIESSGKRDLRKSKIFEKNDNYRSYSADLIKLHEVPNTKDSSVRRENKKQLLKNEQPPRNQMKLSKSTFGKNY